MNRDAANKLGSMTGLEIAAWCAQHATMVVIESFRDPHGQAHPVIRIHDEPNLSIDVPALLRRQAE